MTRLLVVLDCKKMGGAERHALDLAESATERGYQVQMAILFKGGSPNFPEFNGKMHSLDATRAGFDVLRKLQRVIAEFCPDVIVSINQMATVVSYWACKRMPERPSILCIFHTTVLPSFFARLKLQVFKKYVKKIEGIIFVSKNQKNYWNNRDLRSGRGVGDLAIPNGIRLERFSQATSEEKIRRREALGYNKNDYIVILCARFHAEKNHAQLIEALDVLSDRLEQLKLIFVGDGPLRENIEKRVAESGLQSKVYFAGEQRVVRDFLALADVAVLTSTSVETFSLAALEAMAVGLPAILSNIGGASEMIVPNHNGLLFEPGDTNALCKAILKLSDYDFRAALGVNAALLVRERYGHQKMMDEYCKVFEKVAHEKYS